jgi:hypothetical protein
MSFTLVVVFMLIVASVLIGRVANQLGRSGALWGFLSLILIGFWSALVAGVCDANYDFRTSWESLVQTAGPFAYLAFGALLVFFPTIVIVGILNVLPDRAEHRTACPYCAEKILPAAKICPFCKNEILNISGSEEGCNGPL